jgi:hypothetical protein
MLRGWCNFYRHAWGAKHVFSAIDHYVWWTIFRWLKKKHRAPRPRRDRATTLTNGLGHAALICQPWSFGRISTFRGGS